MGGNTKIKVKEQAKDVIQLEKIFFSEDQVDNFLISLQYNIDSNTNTIMKYGQKLIAAYLLQKSYIESQIDRMNKIFELSNRELKEAPLYTKDYIILYKLGKGSGGLVDLAYNLKTEKLYAIKNQLNEDGYLIKREIENYKKICHPFIPRFYGIVQSPKLSFVIDYINGFSIDQIHTLNLNEFDKFLIIIEILLTFQYIYYYRKFFN